MGIYLGIGRKNCDRKVCAEIVAARTLLHATFADTPPFPHFLPTFHASGCVTITIQFRFFATHYLRNIKSPSCPAGWPRASSVRLSRVCTWIEAWQCRNVLILSPVLTAQLFALALSWVCDHGLTSFQVKFPPSSSLKATRP